MLDTVPTAEELTNLVGKSLYEIWDSLIALIDESYDMEHIWNNGGKWNIYGIMAAKHGSMNTNTAAAEKRYARSMRGKTVSGLWSSSVKTKGQNLKKNEIATQRKRKPFTTKRRHSTTANG